MTRKTTLAFFLIFIFILTDANAQDSFSPPLSLTGNDFQLSQNSPFEQVRRKRNNRRNKSKSKRFPKDIAFTKGNLYLQASYGMSDYTPLYDSISYSKINKFGPVMFSAEFPVLRHMGVELSYIGLSTNANSVLTYQTLDNHFNVITQELNIDLFSSFTAYSLATDFHIITYGEFLFIPESVMKRFDLNYGFGLSYFSESSRVSYNSQYFDDVSETDKRWGMNFKISVKYFITRHLGVFYETRDYILGDMDDFVSTSNLGVVYKLRVAK